ncbi:MAG TPA: glycoside hydrolase family 99-like domain-containing protein [Thermoanaerobaculia bacterium]
MIVSGMHRSGTSALARVLSLQGAELPAHLLRKEDGLPGDGNSIAGFWESRPLMLLHEEALIAAGAAWDKPTLIHPAWFQSDVAEAFVDRLVGVLRREFGTAPLIVPKDPRISRLAPLWTAALRILGITPHWLITVRNPLDVAGSLAHRDGMPLHRSLFLWLVHTLEIERETRGASRLFVSFDDLLSDWRSVVRRIDDALGLQLPGPDIAETAAIDAFLDHDLRHHRASLEEITTRGDVSDWVKRTYLWALEASTAATEPPSSELDEVVRALETAHALFGSANGASDPTDPIQPVRVESSLDDLALSEKREAIVRLHATVGALHRADLHLAERQGELASRQKQFADRQEQISTSIIRLQEASALAEQREKSLRSSVDELRQTSRQFDVSLTTLKAEADAREIAFASKVESLLGELAGQHEVESSLRITIEELRNERERMERGFAGRTTGQSHASGARSIASGDSARLGPRSRVSTIAFYLPQFHPIPENDECWGTGFTEWTNVVRARPQFDGHQQPVLPSDLGFYDLRVPAVWDEQAALARAYGVDGFCIYYYWFGGKRVLEKPLDGMLETGQPDFPFCICWANENWTRRWDGQDDDIILAQDHTAESDDRFIVDALPVLLDPRYIRVDGKPMLLVYRADLLVDPLRTTKAWREAAHRAGLPGLHLCAVWKVDDPRSIGFDALVEFPPHHFPHAELTEEYRRQAPSFEGQVYDYAEGVRLVRPLQDQGFTVHRGVMPSWDNTPRRGRQAHLFVRNTPELYGLWLENVIRESAARPGAGDQFVFINSWNEWAETAMLEPSQTHGRRYLEETRRAVHAASRYPERRWQPIAPEQTSESHTPADSAFNAPASIAPGFVPANAGSSSPLNMTHGLLALAKSPIWLLMGRLPSRLRWWREMRRLRTNGHFDPEFYLSRHPEVAQTGADPIYHFVRLGVQEGHAPHPQISSASYKAVTKQQPSLGELWFNRAYGIIPLVVKWPVWLALGRASSRLEWWREMRTLLRSGAFDQEAYLRQNPWLPSQKTEPVYHYVRYGRGAKSRPAPAASVSSSFPAETAPSGPSPAPRAKVSYPSRTSTRASGWTFNSAQLRVRKEGAIPLLFVSHDAARAGAQIIMLRILETLAKRQEFELFLLLRSGGELRPDFERFSHVLDLQELQAPDEKQAVLDALEMMGMRPALAFCNTVASGPVASVLHERGVPVVANLLELPTTIDALGPEMLRDVLASSKATVVASEFVRAALIRHYAIPEKALTVIHAGVPGWNGEAEDRAKARARIREQLGIPADGRIVLGCGTVHHRKGTDLFVQAARTAIRDLGLENAWFIWVGADEAGPLFRTWCVHDLAASGLDSRVVLIGPRENTRDFYLAADAFLLTSREDPFPLVNLEAMARGLPVVAFAEAGGAPEALRDGAGIVVPYLDVVEMAREVVRILDAPRYAALIRERAQARANERFRWDHYVEKLCVTIRRHAVTS